MTDQQDERDQRDPEETAPAADDQPRDPESVQPPEQGVEPVAGDQGEYVNQGESLPSSATASEAGFDPNRPVATSPPPPEAQSGVPALEGGGNEGVEPQPQYAGSVDPGTPAEGDEDPEADPAAE